MFVNFVLFVVLLSDLNWPQEEKQENKYSREKINGTWARESKKI